MHPAASDTIAKVAAMAALRPLLRADPISIGRAGWSRRTADAQAMKSLAICLRGPAGGSSRRPENKFFSAGPALRSAVQLEALLEVFAKPASISCRRQAVDAGRRRYRVVIPTRTVAT
jgi:hypothetical protein